MESTHSHVSVQWLVEVWLISIFSHVETSYERISGCPKSVFRSQTNSFCFLQQRTFVET